MTHYYNDNDPGSVAWLTELTRTGNLPVGHIDNRSILDVEPDDLRAYTQCHFFAGIGGWPLALRLAGWPEDREVWTGSAPCQPFSQAGRGDGYDDERHLAPTWLDLIRKCRPATIFGEQTSSPSANIWLSDLRLEMEALGYAFGAANLPAASVGAPHLRHRLFFGAIRLADTASERRGQTGRDTASNSETDGGWSGDRSGDGGAHVQRGGLADSADAGRERGRSGETRDGGDTSRIEPERLRDTGWLEHTTSDGRIERGTESSGRGITSGRSDSGLADSDGRDASAERQQRSGEHGQFAENRGTGRLGHTDCLNEAEIGRISQWSKPDATRNRVYPWSSSLDSFWRDADWLGCRDGKFRPVEPGTFPLANGIPGRVGLLRGYGNGIVPQVAAEFVKCLM